MYSTFIALIILSFYFSSAGPATSMLMSQPRTAVLVLPPQCSCLSPVQQCWSYHFNPHVSAPYSSAGPTTSMLTSQPRTAVLVLPLQCSRLSPVQQCWSYHFNAHVSAPYSSAGPTTVLYSFLLISTFIFLSYNNPDIFTGLWESLLWLSFPVKNSITIMITHVWLWLQWPNLCFFSIQTILFMHHIAISTTNLGTCVCVCAKFDQFLPVRSQFDSNQHVNSVRTATFQSANFGPLLFALYCYLFFLRKQNKEWIDFAILCDVLKISSPGNRYMAPPPPTKTVTAHFGQDPFRPYAAHN